MVTASPTFSAPTLPARILVSILLLERSILLPPPMPLISTFPMPASQTLTRQTPPTTTLPTLLTSIASPEMSPLALSHSPISTNLVLPPLPPGLSSADPTLPSTRTTRTIVVLQHPWSPSPFLRMPSWTIWRRRRRMRRAHRLVSRIPPEPSPLPTSSQGSESIPRRPLAPVLTETACAVCILVRLLLLPQSVDRIVCLLVNWLLGARGKSRTTTKVSPGQ